MSNSRKLEPTRDNADHVESVYVAGLRQWERAEQVASLLALDANGLGGAWLSAAAGPVRHEWLALLQDLLPDGAPRKILPVTATPDRLAGGLSLEKMLAGGRLSKDAGLLEQARGGLLIASMAERMEATVAGVVADAMDDDRANQDQGYKEAGRSNRFGLILIDEGLPGEPPPPSAVTERLAFRLQLNQIPSRVTEARSFYRDDVLAAQAIYADVVVSDAQLEAIVGAATALGLPSMRLPLFCLRAARGLASFGGRQEADDRDIAEACALVLSPLLNAPLPEPAQEPPPEPEETGVSKENSADANDLDQPEGLVEDQIIEAVRAAAISNALSSFAASSRSRRHETGRSGDVVSSNKKGRPDRPVPRSRNPRGRVDLPATFRAAAPLQTIRKQSRRGGKIAFRGSDLRVKKFKHRSETVVIFVVDASGSSALNRMAEAKGAIEHLLAECYGRRDHVAMITVRGAEADLALPPTRSLVRARRILSGLPSGGTTPLASGIMICAALAEQERRRGRTPYAVFMTDGRGNTTLDGHTDREAAAVDLEVAARRLNSVSMGTLVFDTSRRAGVHGQTLAGLIGADYRPLPYADGKTVSNIVRRAID